MFGIDAGIIAALIGAGGTAYGVSQNNRALSGRAAINDQLTWDMQQQEMQFNRDMSNIDRQYNAEQAGIGRDFSASQSQKAMDFSERMSNTQYQRATADMQAAGLNPMLAYSQGGAGNVSGVAGSPSTASSSPARTSGPTFSSMPNFQSAIGAGISSALQAVNTLTGVEQMEAATDETKARTMTHLANVEAIKASTHLTGAQERQIDQLLKPLVYEWEQGFRQRRSFEEVQQAISSTDKGIHEANTARETFRQARQETQARDFDMPRRSGEAQFHQMLNESLKGGASSAGGIKDILLKGLSGVRGLFGGR